MSHVRHKALLLPVLVSGFWFLASGLLAQERADSTMMQEVSINGQRQRISYRLDRQRINASQVLTAQGGTAMDVLRAVPGVVVDAEGNLSYRGSQEFQVYVDGKLSPLTGTEAFNHGKTKSERFQKRNVFFPIKNEM